MAHSMFHDSERTCNSSLTPKRCEHRNAFQRRAIGATALFFGWSAPTCRLRQLTLRQHLGLGCKHSKPGVFLVSIHYTGFKLGSVIPDTAYKMFLEREDLQFTMHYSEDSKIKGVDLEVRLTKLKRKIGARTRQVCMSPAGTMPGAALTFVSCLAGQSCFIGSNHNSGGGKPANLLFDRRLINVLSIVRGTVLSDLCSFVAQLRKGGRS